MAAVSGVDFDQAGFEAGIRQAMGMAQPVSTGDLPVFHFLATTTTTAPADGRGVPFDPTATATTAEPTPVTNVLCAMEFSAGVDQDSRLGRLDESPLTITFLDAEYQKIKGCDHMTVGGMRYDFESFDGPYGLFTSAVWITYWNAHGGTVSTK